MQFDNQRFDEPSHSARPSIITDQLEKTIITVAVSFHGYFREILVDVQAVSVVRWNATTLIYRVRYPFNFGGSHVE